MAELKTKKTDVTVDSFLKTIKDIGQRKDSLVIMELMKKATKSEAKMWGPAIIGFGDVRLKYESGRELDWFLIGFSPRKAAMSLYIKGAVEDKNKLLEKLGKHKTAKGCLYINKLEDVNLNVLKEIIEVSVK